MNDLEEATIGELVRELMGRTTFRGVVAYQIEPERKGSLRWRRHASNCDAKEVFRQLLKQEENR